MLALKDLDHTGARLHGRRALLPDAGRLRALCALGGPGELATALYPGAGIKDARGLAGRLLADLAAEAQELASCFSGAQARLLEWNCARFAAVNLKLAVRALHSGRRETAALLLPLPAGQEAYGAALAGAADMGALVKALPEGPLKEGLAASYARRPSAGGFLHEAAVDRAYFGELAAIAAALGGGDGGWPQALARQEVAAYNLMLAARGRFELGLPERELLACYAPGSDIDLTRFKAMLAAPGPLALRAMAAGRAVFAGPEERDPAALEALARARYAALARRAWRGSHMGFGAVAGYAALRRLYVEDMTSLAEGLRLGMPAAELWARLGPREGAYA